VTALLSAPRRNELAPRREFTGQSRDATLDDPMPDCKKRQGDKKKLTMNQTQHDSRHTHDEPDGGERQSDHAIDARQYGSMCHRLDHDAQHRPRAAQKAGCSNR
jgi:hypothetical protein